MIGKNRIMIYGPKDDGTYVVEFRTAEGHVLPVSIPRTEAAVIRRFQERMPYGLFVPDASTRQVWHSVARLRTPHWLKFKNPAAPAVKREAEEDWGRGRGR